MGVYIGGVEMPIGSDELRLIVRSNGQVIISHKTYFDETEAIPVPPHGDLIDYDFCMQNYELLHDDDGNPVYAVRMREINSAPTIIPAEEGE